MSDRPKILAWLKREAAPADKSLREMGFESSTPRHRALAVFGSQLRAARAMLALSRNEDVLVSLVIGHKASCTPSAPRLARGHDPPCG